jgi:hypothetical protein
MFCGDETWLSHDALTELFRFGDLTCRDSFFEEEKAWKRWAILSAVGVSLAKIICYDLINYDCL